MRVSIIANGFQEHYIINLINSLAKETDELDFIGSSIYHPDQIDGNIKFHNLRGEHDDKVSALKKIRRIVNYYYKLLKYFVISKPDIVHIQWYRFPLLEGILMSISARILGIKVVYTAHDVVPHDKDTPISRFLFWWIYRFQNYLIVHTEFIKKRLIKEFGISEKKIYVIRHGVYEVNKSSTLTREDARKHFSLKDGEFVLLFFGIVTRYKGLNLLLEAFSKLSAELHVKLIVAGKVSDDYKEEMNQLLAKYSDKEIIFLLKHISDSEVDLLFKAADSTILPYLEASQSGVLFMSYAYGKPVVAPNLGGFPYDVISNDTGFLFEAKNTDSLREALKSLILSWSKKEIDANEAIQKYAQENYSWQKSAAELLKIYSGVH